ncbi:predicted protein [Naegleria gruberi]|uniref:Predicted protein n=1 Tax=Naegleria gruberi TaxID=5762 RepID=D2W0H1_NAEGR|nr:uncharacterized protein NAEGRDRAFT_44843 [Naegleria gruberi]EFC37427.1 predicted protein [Naegleria gruberi]|eukprot:XP_002670171.1 predicted protein [Naegleria gruberi strain NEG-M]
MKGKIVLITGVAKGGISYETCRVLLSLGAVVVMTMRNVKSGEETRRELIKESKCLEEQAHVLSLDLADLRNVERFVEVFKTKFNSTCHVLINNAGLYNPLAKLTSDNIESHFGVNHLGHFYLTELLMDVLVKSKTRVIVVSSKLHEYYTPSEKLFTTKEEFYQNDGSKSKNDLYSRSKFANILYCKKLDRIFQEKDTSNDRACCVSLHPGLVTTSIATHGSFRTILLYKFLALISKDKVHGAQTSIHCALIDRSEIKGGEYFKDCAISKSNPLTNDHQMQDDLWELSLELISLCIKK